MGKYGKCQESKTYVLFCDRSFFFFTMALPAHSGPSTRIQFRNHFSQTAGLLGRVISSSQGLYLNTGQHKHRINTYTHQISMPRVGFEPTILASKRAKTVHALERAATMTGCDWSSLLVFRSKSLPLTSDEFRGAVTYSDVKSYLVQTCHALSWRFITVITNALNYTPWLPVS
jgi:hypothetical protein